MTHHARNKSEGDDSFLMNDVIRIPQQTQEIISLGLSRCSIEFLLRHVMTSEAWIYRGRLRAVLRLNLKIEMASEAIFSHVFDRTTSWRYHISLSHLFYLEKRSPCVRIFITRKFI